MRINKVQPLTSVELRTKVYWYGFIDYETDPISFNYPMHRILPVIDYDFSYPLMIYFWIGSITPLETMMHSDSSYYNEKGLHIYLNEPMSSYLEDGIAKTNELDSILIYVKNNNFTNVTVHTCDYKCDEIYSYYSEYMNLVTDDIFLRILHPLETTLKPDTFTKKFINLNRRFVLHRNFTAAYMANKSGYCSWNYTSNIDELKSIYVNVELLDSMVDGRLLEGLNYLNQHAPLIVDAPVASAVHVDNPLAANNPEYTTQLSSAEKYYADVFCAVETETVFLSPAANISEKILRAIAYEKPFILVGAVHSLEYLRSMGYKTFSDYWDESYDSELDHTRRLAKIFKLIDHIDSMTIDELHDLYNSMRPVLEHNKQLLLERQPTVEFFKNLPVNSKLRQTLWVHHNRYYSK